MICVVTVGVVPVVNQNTRGDPVLSMNGFTVAWNPPADVNLTFIKNYTVRIEEVSEGNGRRKRQAPITRTTTTTSFTFDEGKPFTNYSVSVNATLDVNGVTGEVVALARTPIRSGEARMLLCGVTLLLPDHTPFSCIGTFGSCNKWKAWSDLSDTAVETTR